MKRHFDLQCYLLAERVVDMVLDASPWGLAGVLTINGTPREYFADAITEADLQRFGHALGDAAGQQTWESLAALVAVRTWRAQWQQHRVAGHPRLPAAARRRLLSVPPGAEQGGQLGAPVRESCIVRSPQRGVPRSMDR